MKYAMLGAMLLFFGGLFAKVSMDDARAYRANEARALAEQLTVTSGAVRAMVATSAMVDGELARGSIPHPAWMELPQQLYVRTQGSITYVYLEAESDAQAARVIREIDGRTREWVDFTAGRNVNRELVRTRPGPPITLPEWMPESAVVIVI